MIFSAVAFYIAHIIYNIHLLVYQKHPHINILQSAFHLLELVQLRRQLPFKFGSSNLITVLLKNIKLTEMLINCVKIYTNVIKVQYKLQTIIFLLLLLAVPTC